MPDYIKNTGSTGSTNNAELSGTYTKQASEHSLRFGGDGEADTLKTLSTSTSWLMVEIYDVEAVTGDIGYTKWQNDITEVLSDLAVIQALIDDDVQITNYKMVATEYDHTEPNTANIYRGDESTAIVLTEAGTSFTVPSGTWKLSNTTTAPIEDELPPIYLLEEDLYEIGGYYWLVNSAVGATTKYYGKLCNASGGTWTTVEVAARYDKEAKTIDLSDEYYIDTGWIAPTVTTWAISGIYDIGDSSYSMYSLAYSGSSTIDVYLCESGESFPVTPTYSAVPYTPSEETWKIHEEPPSVIYPTIIEYTMATFNIV